MSSIDIQEKELLKKWAEKNDCNHIFEEIGEVDSYFVERVQDCAGIWNYHFSTIGELKSMISEITGNDMEPELEKLVVVSAFKCKNQEREQVPVNEIGFAQKEEGEKIPEYIYVF